MCVIFHAVYFFLLCGIFTVYGIVMRTREFIIKKIDRFLKRSKMSDSRFSTLVVGDWRWLNRLRGHAEMGVTLRSIEAAETFIEKHSPKAKQPDNGRASK